MNYRLAELPVLLQLNISADLVRLLPAERSDDISYLLFKLTLAQFEIISFPIFFLPKLLFFVLSRSLLLSAVCWNAVDVENLLIELTNFSAFSKRISFSHFFQKYLSLT